MLEQLRDSSSAQMTLLAIVVGVLAIVAIYLYVRSRLAPKDKEKRRRLTVNQTGRIGDAMITDVQDDIIFYEYSVRGVLYTASQDISQLRDRIPSDPDRLIGPCGLKYSTANPANSIILCEDWSGLRINSVNTTSELSKTTQHEP